MLLRKFGIPSQDLVTELIKGTSLKPDDLDSIAMFTRGADQFQSWDAFFNEIAADIVSSEFNRRFPDAVELDEVRDLKY